MSNMSVKDMNIFLRVIRSEAKKEVESHKTAKFLWGTVVTVSDNGMYADIEVAYSAKPAIFEHIHNKTNTALQVNDAVLLLSPIGDLSSIFIICTKARFPSINGSQIKSDIDGQAIKGDLTGIDNITDVKNIQSDRVQSNSFSTSNITTNNLIIQEAVSGGSIAFQALEMAQHNNRWLVDAGMNQTVNKTITIPIPAAMQEAINTNIQYIVKFYPNESCDYTITQLPTSFTITTDKDVAFGWEIMGLSK